MILQIYILYFSYANPPTRFLRPILSCSLRQVSNLITSHEFLRVLCCVEKKNSTIQVKKKGKVWWFENFTVLLQKT